MTLKVVSQTADGFQERGLLPCDQSTLQVFADTTACQLGAIIWMEGVLFVPLFGSSPPLLFSPRTLRLGLESVCS